MRKARPILGRASEGKCSPDVVGRFSTSAMIDALRYIVGFSDLDRRGLSRIVAEAQGTSAAALFV
jgi:hypothetical protein